MWISIPFRCKQPKPPYVSDSFTHMDVLYAVVNPNGRGHIKKPGEYGRAYRPSGFNVEVHRLNPELWRDLLLVSGCKSELELLAPKRTSAESVCPARTCVLHLLLRSFSPLSSWHSFRANSHVTRAAEQTRGSHEHMHTHLKACTRMELCMKSVRISVLLCLYEFNMHDSSYICRNISDIMI